MANYMKEVAKLLDIELGEKFRIMGQLNDYRITENGVEVFYDEEEGWLTSAKISLDFLLTGRYIIEKKWKPQKDERYYTPFIATNPNNMFETHYWCNDDIDIKRYSMGLVYKTLEEAIAITKRMLAVAKEVRENDKY